MQHIVEETNRYAQQQIAKSVTPFTFHSRIRKWQDVTVDEMCAVLALFMVMGILQKPTQSSYYSQNRLLFTSFFSETLPPGRLELIVRFLHFINNSTASEYQGPVKLFKIYPTVPTLEQNKKFVPPKPGHCYRRVFDSVERPSVFQAVYTSESCQIWDKIL
jgi:hypothetical protein